MLTTVFRSAPALGDLYQAGTLRYFADGDSAGWWGYLYPQSQDDAREHRRLIEVTAPTQSALLRELARTVRAHVEIAGPVMLRGVDLVALADLSQ